MEKADGTYMSDTPRTDAAEDGDHNTGWVPAAFARELELENAELLDALAMMYDTACTNATSTPSKAAFLKALAVLSKARGEVPA